MLTAKQIVEKNLIFLSDENKANYGITELFPAQVGIDLHIVSCNKMIPSSTGEIYNDNSGRKTKLPITEPVKLWHSDMGTDNAGYWVLTPGQYEIGFAEGCKFDDKHFGKIVHRSSVRRCGGEINSPLFDPGFYTNEMGTFLTVHQEMRIEKGARVAQIFIYECNEAAELYGSIEGKSHYQGTGVLNGHN